MPLIQIKVIEGVLTSEQKREMIEKVTAAVVSIEGEGLRPYTVTLIEEVKSGDWAVGGKPISTEEARAVAKAEKAA